MDRLSQLRGEAGGSGDSTLDTTSPPSEAYMSANENSSKYFSVADSTFDITPIKDVSLASTSADSDRTSVADELISNLSPIGKKDVLDSYKIGKQIEAANILSGGVDIFDDNDNSFDGNELVIDDNIESDDKSNADNTEAANVDREPDADLEPEVDPDLEADPDPEADPEHGADPELEAEPLLVEEEANVPNREMEVVLQIDGNNVNAIDIGNGLYLYRKDGHEELAAVQIVNGDPQHSFKFLKVRDNDEGNLEVYEEIEIEVPKEVPTKEGKPVDMNNQHVPIVDTNKATSNSSTSKVNERIHKSPQKEPVASTSKSEKNSEEKESSPESKTEFNLNGKMVKFSESRKSPIVGSFTPMTFHSTPNKGKPLTKTMVDLQLDPNRHSDNVKKTIEVHTDSVKQKSPEPIAKENDLVENDKSVEEKEILMKKGSEVTNKLETKDQVVKKISPEKKHEFKQTIDSKSSENTEENLKPDITDQGKKADAGKLVIEKQSTHAKSSENTQESFKTDINLDKKKDATSEMELIPINNKECGIVQSKLDKSVVLPSSISGDTNNAISKVNVASNKKTETSNKTNVEKNKSKDVDPLTNSGKDINISIMTKNELMGDTVEKDTPSNVEKVENTVNERMKAVNNDKMETKDVENSLKTLSDISNARPTDGKVENSIKSVEDIEVPLDTLSDMTSASTNFGTEESNGESITLYAVDTDESVSLMTPSSTTKTNEDKVNLVNISEVLTKISNIANTSNENTAIDKQKAEVSTVNKIDVERMDQIDGTCKTTDQASSLTKSAEKPKVLEKSNNHVTKKTVKHSSIPVPEVKIPEKAACSGPVIKVKPSEITKLSIPMPKVKLSEEVGHPTLPKLKHLEKETLPPVLEVKSSEEKVALTVPTLDIKSSEKSTSSILAPDVNIAMTDATPSEKAAITSVLEVEPPEKISSIPLPGVKPSEIAKLSKPLPEVKTQLNINKTAKPDSHASIVANIGNKPSSKHIPPVIKLKSEGIKKGNDNVVSKEVSEKNNVGKKSTQIKIESREIKELIGKTNLETKPVNNNHSAAVPFGQWTDVNRQEFLNKFKEVKAPISTNSKQIKNSNDLNRRDVLQKIDSQRAQTIINNATAKAHEKLNVKNESVFSNKVVQPKLETKIPVKTEITDKKVSNKVTTKRENLEKASVSSTVSTSSAPIEAIATVSKIEPAPRDLSTATMASLIDKTIEDMINRVVPCKNVADEPKQAINANEPDSAAQIPVQPVQISKTAVDDSGTLDDIEMKMNELHGIPFVERPPHELPKFQNTEIKTYSKMDKDKPMSKVNSEPKVVKENIIDIDSEEEVIEHEPITGDIELNKITIPDKSPAQNLKSLSIKSGASAGSKDASNKESIITETDFDKFARRNSMTYENCLTVNFDRKEPHNVVQTVKEKDVTPKMDTKNEIIGTEATPKVPQKQPLRHNVNAGKVHSATKFGAVTGDPSNKNSQSKIHSAYQSALVAKRHILCPLKIIEDKPVKVVYVESSTGFVPSQLNVQGQELSPVKKPVTVLDTATTSNTDSVDLDIMLEVIEENKQQDKVKTKHQRKQVLTPVEAPDLELIQPSDLEASPKKKRRTEDIKVDKQSKNLVHKKSYLLGRNTTTEDQTSNIQVVAKDTPKETIKRSEDLQERKDTASAIDNLVKAAELLENQAETINKSTTPNSDSQPNTPVKRGRGRPRKYPLPEGAAVSKTPSPQKKPRLIDAKPVKHESFSDEHDDDSSGEEMVRENWTMGKINENIVCPICNKLFRSENVVFKHVKHCTGVSPNRSESDKRSPRRARLSQESEDMNMDDEIFVNEEKKETPKKRKSKESTKSETETDVSKPEVDKDDVIVIDDSLTEKKPEKNDKENEDEPKQVTKAKAAHRANNLVCEFCGKTFRQLSYLVSHKLHHKKEQTKKTEKDTQDSNKLQVFSCEVCKKEFRKLHHLVQHRIIHNPDSVPKRTLRKSSSEQSEPKNVKDEAAKLSEDPSAAFRCEPCDKSFRKLHHLVEHRETHDGINRQKPSAPAQPTVEKLSPPPQCEICKKTFRKLHHLIEHKEQHADTSSEKSDDKSVQSALSTKDIIHECSLCYMVFPNEHSLNKHSVNCSKKKRQSKQPKDVTENESVKDDEKSKAEERKDEGEGDDVPKIDAKEIIDVEEAIVEKQDIQDMKILPEVEKVIEVEKVTEKEIKQTEDENVTKSEVPEKPSQKEIVVKSTELQSAPTKRDFKKLDGEKIKETSVVPQKIKKIDHKEVKDPDIVLKKKAPMKDKPAVTKRQKTIEAALAALDKVKPAESSDDDEVRYMLNPNYKVDETMEAKTFMQIRASKRSSLQFDHVPNSNDHAKRRTSLQHPPKISRLKPKTVEPKLKTIEPKPKAPEPKRKSVEPKSKAIESKPPSAPPSKLKHIPKLSEAEAVLSTDSDDSDVKYSFPKIAPEISKPVPERSPNKIEKKSQRKSLVEKRKSLSGIAKRKSLGKAITAKHKVITSPVKPIRKRTTEVEHRCDCGQLFSSAALLSRHTSLAHTPPRIRRRRSSPAPAPVTSRPPKRTSTGAEKTKPAPKKSSLKTEPNAADSKPSASTRKSSVRTEAATPTDTRKSIKANGSELKASCTKTRRTPAHAGVPVPEKMKKIMVKNKK